MPEDDPKHRVYSYYLVACADVLGQSDVFKEYLKGLPPLSGETLPLYQAKLLEAHEKTVQVIEELYADFQTFYDLMMGRVFDIDLPDSLNQMKQFTLTYGMFSDSFVAYAPFFHIPDMECLYPSIRAAFCAIVAHGYLMLKSLCIGKPIRGAMEIDFATRLRDRKPKDSELDGPVYYQAHRLEKEVAKYPRIVVGDTLREFLAFAQKGKPRIPNQGDEDVRASSKAASRCLKMIAKDVDGFYIIDYVGEVMQQAISAEIMEDLKNRAYEFAKSQYSRWKKDDNYKLAGRYHLLMNYLRQSGTLSPG
jgi:hypothetical protein